MNNFTKWLACVIKASVCLLLVTGILTLVAFIVAKLGWIGILIICGLTIGTLLFLNDEEDYDE